MSDFDENIKKSKQHKCPNCGSNMHFSPEQGKLVCDHCASTQDVSRNRDVRERDFSEFKNRSKSAQVGVTYYRCRNCGASTKMSDTTIATTCPFCGSPVVVEKNELDTVRPDSVIPFEITQKSAQRAVLRWRKKRWLAPRKFRKFVEVDSVRGVYTPVWTFDSSTYSTYEGRLGERRTRTVTRNGKSQTETYIEWYRVSGAWKRIFDDVFISGSGKMPSSEIDKLHPFPQSKYVVYSDEFLQGYVCDNYTVGPEEAFERAKIQMENVIRSEIVSHYGADEVDYLNVKVSYEGNSFKYLLLPIYVTAAKYKGNVYNNYVSGISCGKDKNGEENVKVSGNYPKSAWKIALIVLLAIAAAVGVIFLALSGEGGVNVDVFGRVSSQICPITSDFAPNPLTNFQIQCITYV